MKKPQTVRLRLVSNDGDCMTPDTLELVLNDLREWLEKEEFWIEVLTEGHPKESFFLRRIHKALPKAKPKEYGIYWQSSLFEENPMAPLNKPCARPWTELNIDYNGAVPICVLDQKREFVVGKLDGRNHSARSIWFGFIYGIIRSYLLRRERLFAPCYKCQYKGGKWKTVIEEPRRGIECLPWPELGPTLLKYHLMRFRKYSHSSVRGNPFFFDSSQGGINKFL